MERKEFIRKFAVGGSILFSVPAFLTSCAVGDEEIFPNGIHVDLTSSEFSDLGTTGGFAYKNDIIIIREDENTYVALSKICTHQGCTVSYNASTNQLPCPCHGSIYAITGQVINGPAPAPLTKYSTKVEGNTLIIS